MSINPRMHRLFGTDRKCFDVAIDHGFFNELNFLDGIENMESAVNAVVEASPDAIQLTPGQAHFIQNVSNRHKPVLVLRTDVANVYGKELQKVLFSELIKSPVETALRIDAACVVVNLLLLPDEPDLYHQCIKNICQLKPECERFGMPLMIEPLVMQVNDNQGGYMVDGDINKIRPLVRQAVELGADIIKADPCDDPEQYHEVIEVASGVPVLVRGGGRVSDMEILERTYALMQHGASGIVYGRNVIQHPKPNQITRALMAIVHDDATPEKAMDYLQN